MKRVEETGGRFEGTEKVHLRIKGVGYLLYVDNQLLLFTIY
jgi:hypothetical protein